MDNYESLWENWTMATPDRKTRALNAEITPLSLDTDNATATFASSEGSAYTTSLTDCSCMDFTNNGGIMPCKHICRLAMELGVLDSTGMETDVAVALRKQQKNEIQTFIRTAPLSDAIKFVDTLNNIAHKKKIAFIDFNFTFGDMYFVEEDKKGNCAIIKAYSPIVKTLNSAIETRIGRFVMRNLQNQCVVDMLAGLDGSRIDAN